MLGNKGGVCISLTLHHTSLAFVNVHLAAHQENTALRNKNVQSIVKSLKFEGGDLFTSSHHVVLLGDLNMERARAEAEPDGSDRSDADDRVSASR